MKKKTVLKNIKLKISGHNHSEIIIGYDIFNQISPILSEKEIGKNIVCITNPELKSLFSSKLNKSLEPFRVSWITIPEGESQKNLNQVKNLLDTILSLKLERKDTIIALGGGVIGDLAGFVASIYKRGINLIQIPTSLLAQVDAAIGGKTGVNHTEGKNLIGTFYQPLLTFIDTQCIETLPKREILCGLAEVVKYGIIRNPEFFSYIQRHQKTIKELNPISDPEIWSHIIQESAQEKANIVIKDEKESGLREILNLGHTYAHGIETYFSYQDYKHGEAVALGIAIASYTALQLRLLTQDNYNKILNLLQELGFNLTLKPCDTDKIREHMMQDKKIRAEKLRFILPIKIGSVITRDDIKVHLIKEAINHFTQEKVKI